MQWPSGETSILMKPMALPPLSQLLETRLGLSQDTSLIDLVEVFTRSSFDYVVILDAQDYPIGVVRAGRLMGYLVSGASWGERERSRVGGGDWLEEDYSVLAGVPPHRAGPTLAPGEPPRDWSACMEAIPVVTLETSIASLLSGFLPGTAIPWAVVDEHQKYLGIVQPEGVLRSLATHTFAAATPAPDLPPAGDRPSPSEASSWSDYPGQFLQELLEQLPLALSLQTTDGTLLVSNGLWDAHGPAVPSLDWQSLPSLSDLASAIGSPIGQPPGGWDRPRQGCLPWLHRLEFANPIIPEAAIDPHPCRWVRLPLTMLVGEEVPQRLPLLDLKALWETPPRPESWPVVDAPSLTARLLAHPGLLERPLSDLWLVLALPQSFSKESVASAPTKQTWLLELSHELKSPLTSLLGLSTLLKDPRMGSLNRKQAHYARLIHRTVQQLIAIINDLLDWFRLDTGQLALFPTLVNLPELGNQVLHALEAKSWLLDASDIPLSRRFSWTTTADAHIIVADPLRLRQMLQHMISNVLSHTEPQTPCGLQAEYWGDWLALTVWDQGPGISPHLQPHLFQRLMSPSLAEKVDQRSLGLGLTLTWHLARLHGGDITFVSSSQMGSRFTLLLPQVFTQSLEDMDVPPDWHPPPSSTTLLLLSCTDPEVVDRVWDTLQNTPYRMAIARSPHETLDKIQRLHPTAWLIHLDSLGSQGWTWVEQIEPAPPSPTPAMFALGRPEHIPESLGPRLTGHLTVEEIPQRLCSSLDQQPGSGGEPGKDLLQTISKLTILYLTADLAAQPAPDTQHPAPFALHHWLQRYHCRILEVDDLHQADLLARVWLPHVVLLDTAIPHPDLYLGQLNQLPHLRSLPLVTLNPQLSQAALSYPQLSLFPCHLLEDSLTDRMAIALMQTITRAAQGSPANSRSLQA